MRARLCYTVALFAAALGQLTLANPGPYIELPKAGLLPHQLAVLYLKGNEQSEAIARYYQQQRGIPSANLIAITLPADKTSVGVGEFAVQKNILDRRLSSDVQALALAWATPYQVGCMSITAAFALGYDVAYCASGCKATRTSPYYHSGSSAPFNDFAMRPTIMLAASNTDDALRLIDRGIKADNSLPLGHAFLLKTSDKRRSVRHVFFDEIDKTFGDRLDIHILNRDAIKHRSDILFYFTGKERVQHLDTLSFLPGAMADHLTSAGGQLTDSSQMSALRWIEAGATGSYGSALEPCNFVEKFPNPLLAMWHYLSGATMIEAYWKSVHMPGQGNFIGEPLASPFNGYRLLRKKDRIQVYSPVLRHGQYRIIADNGFDDWSLSRGKATNAPLSALMEQVSMQSVSKYRPYLELKPPYQRRYRIERLVQ